MVTIVSMTRFDAFCIAEIEPEAIAQSANTWLMPQFPYLGCLEQATCTWLSTFNWTSCTHPLQDEQLLSSLYVPSLSEFQGLLAVFNTILGHSKSNTISFRNHLCFDACLYVCSSTSGIMHENDPGPVHFFFPSSSGLGLADRANCCRNLWVTVNFETSLTLCTYRKKGYLKFPLTIT